MKISNLYLILSAVGAGYLGGALASHASAEASAPQVLRASGFELVSASGDTVARLATDEAGNAHLCFYSRTGNVALDIGTFRDGDASLEMNALDGKPRLRILVDREGKPSLGMGDEKRAGRLELGFLRPDSAPYGDWDQWGLIFRMPGASGPVIGMGVSKTASNPAEPRLTVSGRSLLPKDLPR